MTILSISYIYLFLPISLGVFWAAHRLAGARTAVGVLALCSLIYCLLDQPNAVSIILISVTFNYVVGRVIGVTDKDSRWRLLVFLTGILGNIGLLSWFKYSSFFIESLGSLLGGGWQALPKAALPLGISYYTFQQIAYLVDVKRGLAPERNLVNYLLYVIFFPKITMGPIVRPQEFFPQLSSQRLGILSHTYLAQGLSIFLLGLAKKTLLAGSLAPFADQAFAAAAKGHTPEMIAAWGAMLAYSLQIYFDFSGYTDMALGAAQMLGIKLPVNFDSPYRSINVADFWRRWHMSLSFWLRDYIYIPLGGSRRGRGRRYLNVFATMLICGLWHGTGFLFLIWGGLHALFIVIHNLWQMSHPYTVRLREGLPTILRVWMARLFTFLCVSLAWIFFRADSLSSALNMFRGLVGMGGLIVTFSGHIFLFFYLACGLGLVWLFPEIKQYVMGVEVGRRRQPEERFFFSLSWRPSLGHGLFVLIIGLWALARLATGTTQFLYYQF